MDPKLKNGIYSIPCSCGELYIGETSRSIKLRLKEHCANTIHERTKKLAVAEHSSRTDHHVCSEEAKVLALEEHYNKRHIHKAIEVEKHPRNFNREDDLILCKAWKPIIDAIRLKEDHSNKNNK